MGGHESAATDAEGNADALLASLADAEVAQDPYPVYERLRAIGPAVRLSSGATLLTGYDDCADVLRSPGFGAQSPEWADRTWPGWRGHPAYVATFEAMLFRDPPVHTRLRRAVSGAFTPRRVGVMRDQVRALVNGVLDALADAGSGGSPVDLQEVLAASLPISVIGKLAGVPAGDWPALRPAVSELLAAAELGSGGEELVRADRAAGAIQDYFEGLAADRRRRPGDDLFSGLVASSAAGSQEAGPGASAHGEEQVLTHAELVRLITFVFMAGVDTMVNLLTSGTAALLAHPRQASALCADPGLTSGAVEEVLRYDAPVQLVGRVAGTGCELRGVTVPADGLVIALIGAANRDPGRFRSPQVFDITRTGSGSLSFGGGIHTCLGSHLARLEAAVFLPALLSRFPALRLAGSPRRKGVVFRGFHHLPVTLR